MAKSCQRQSRHGRTQRLNSWTSSCNNNNSGSDTFQSFQCSPRGFQHFSAMCRWFHVDLQLDTHNRGDQSALRRWQVAQEVPAAVPVLSVFGDLDVPRMVCVAPSGIWDGKPGQAVWTGVFGSDADCFKWSKKSGFIMVYCKNLGESRYGQLMVNGRLMLKSFKF